MQPKQYSLFKKAKLQINTWNALHWLAILTVILGGFYGLLRQLEVLLPNFPLYWYNRKYIHTLRWLALCSFWSKYPLRTLWVHPFLFIQIVILKELLKIYQRKAQKKSNLEKYLGIKIALIQRPLTTYQNPKLLRLSEELSKTHEMIIQIGNERALLLQQESDQKRKLDESEQKKFNQLELDMVYQLSKYNQKLYEENRLLETIKSYTPKIREIERLYERTVRLVLQIKALKDWEQQQNVPCTPQTFPSAIHP